MSRRAHVETISVGRGATKLAELLQKGVVLLFLRQPVGLDEIPTVEFLAREHDAVLALLFKKQLSLLVPLPLAPVDRPLAKGDLFRESPVRVPLPCEPPAVSLAILNLAAGGLPMASW